MVTTALTSLETTHAVVRSVPAKPSRTIVDDLPLPLSQTLRLPEWAVSHLAFGELIAASGVQSSEIIRAAVTVPIRDYTSVLIALGAVVQSFVLTTPPSNTILELRKGASVLYRRGECVYYCHVLNDWKSDPDENIRIRIDCGSGKYQLTSGSIVKVPPNLRHNVEVLLPNGRPIGGVAGIGAIQLAVGKQRAVRFVCESRLEAILCGMKGQLLSEAADLILHDGASACGKALDVLRPFCNNSESYRSDVLTQRASSAESEDTTMSPHIVVFDGATAFLGLRSRWPSANWIVVLNRTDNQELNEQAVDTFKAVFQQAKPLTSIPEVSGVQYQACALERDL